MSTKNLTFSERIEKDSFIASSELQSRLPDDFLSEKDSFITVDNQDFAVRIISATRLFDQGNKLQLDLEIQNFSFLFFLENKEALFKITNREEKCSLLSFFPEGSPTGCDLMTIFIGDA